MPNGPGKRGNGGEFDIIARFFAPLATNPAALGLLDDAAVLSIPEGQELVATCDTIVAGVHFLESDPPDTIGYKALAVSLSDLAAKGARPHVYLLSVALAERPSPPLRSRSPPSACCRKARRCCAGGPWKATTFTSAAPSATPRSG